ncbi:hypothetical protein ITF24_16010 [Acinetobacter baumannii]|nr:hypothetical protein [Acinetobacter baumannii]
MITNRQNVQNNTNTSPHPITQNTLIDRFSPIYWRIDGPQTTSFAITNYGNGFEASFRSRRLCCTNLSLKAYSTI